MIKIIPGMRRVGKSCLQKRIEQLKLQQLLDDVDAFLEHPSERDVFTRDNFLRLLYE